MTLDEKIESYNQQIDDLANEIREQIINGEANWEMPWHKGIPQAKNMYTGKFYGGKNLLILWNKCLKNNWEANHWATFNQWRMIKAQIKRGEKGTLICIAIPKSKGKKGEEQLRIFNPGTSIDTSKLNQYFRFKFDFVWNESQVQNYFGAQPGLFEDPVDPNNMISELVGGSKAEIRSGGDRAFYRPSDDFIQMPDLARFRSINNIPPKESYNSTLLHELIHWTGHTNRCNRDLWGKFGEPLYAFEELIAELGCAILSTHLNYRVAPRDDHAKYIKGWLRPLKNDFSYFTEALEHARSAVYWLFKETDVFPDLKDQHIRKMNKERIEEMISDH